MIDDMTIRNLSPITQASYVHWVRSFALHIGRSPDRATSEDVRAFQLHLVRRKIAWATLNQAVSGLRFFFGITLGRTDLPVRIPYARKAKSLPVVLAADEVGRMLVAVEDLTCRVALACAYATGLRTSEVIAIRIEHIETARELIRVEDGKGAKDRYVMLSPALLVLLRTYWKVERSRPWLFPNDTGTGPLSAATLNAAIKDAAAKTGLARTVTVKTSCRRRAGRDAALLCDPSAGAGDRHPRHPSVARPFPADYDGALHQGIEHIDCSHPEPA